MYVFSRVDSWNSLWTERQHPLVTDYSIYWWLSGKRSTNVNHSDYASSPISKCALWLMCLRPFWKMWPRSGWQSLHNLKGRESWDEAVTCRCASVWKDALIQTHPLSSTSHPADRHLLCLHQQVFTTAKFYNRRTLSQDGAKHSKKTTQPDFFNKRMYITKMRLNSTKQINTTHPNTTTSQCKKGKKKKSHVTNTHAWVVLSITAASPE